MSSSGSRDAREHRVAIALGSNIGDRAGNVVAAIGRLREFVRIDRISSAYETKPVGFTEQPDFLNLASVGWTSLSPRDLRDAMARIERQVGRRVSVPLGPRAIDLDLLLYDGLVSDDETCTIPHPGLTSRAFVLVPLAEIAPELVDPRSGKTIAELVKAVDRSGVSLREGGLLARVQRDVQESRPLVPLSLNRVGVTGVKTLIRAGDPGGFQTIATVDLFADLDAEHSGVHMSRFSQDLEDV
ncbi:MAG TPA: 2-amino-4-hydroxy-6-hydroxymethyldihydropteridine diphosphokinase, partial [Candidatus Acidoferrales bacterium]|nr:2-amino-4-hydroxy-6-hydroxymethyldihydropteridine diphosphokinase [Candidatus Acidoferrales bacterium]